MDAKRAPQEDEFLDRLLEAGLERFKSVEERSGLEDRILTRLQTRNAPLFGSVWALRLGAALAGLAFILAAVYLRRPASDPNRAAARTQAATVPGSKPTRQVTPAPATGMHDAPEAVAQAQRPARHSAQIVAASAPRLGVFPSPAPLTEQERILLGAMKHDDPQVLVAMMEIQQPIKETGPAPVVIEPLEIKPLDSAANSVQQAAHTEGLSNQETDRRDGRK